MSEPIDVPPPTTTMPTESRSAALAPPNALLERVHRPIGRPSLYKPEYCEQALAIAHRIPGASLAIIAVELGTYKQRIAEWAKLHPDFKDALQKCQALSEAHLSQHMLNNPNIASVNAMFFLKCQHAWRDRPDYNAEAQANQRAVTVRIEIVKRVLATVEQKDPSDDAEEAIDVEFQAVPGE